LRAGKLGDERHKFTLWGGSALRRSGALPSGTTHPMAEKVIKREKNVSCFTL